jgi:hypothetical protein
MLYRAGGAGKKEKDDGFNFLRRSWVRDWVIPPVGILALWLLKGVHWNYWWSYLLIWPLMGGALSLYWDDTDNKILDKICRMINWMYPVDNFYVHGFMIGLATSPLLRVGIHWWVILIYAITLSLAMGIISHRIKKFDAVKKEKGRGLAIIFLLLIFKLIG